MTENEEIVLALNNKEAKSNIGAIVLVASLMVIGIIGNSHVLYVYYFKISASNHRLFVLSLGVIDTAACLVGMPFVLFLITRPLLFEVELVCKILRCNNYLTSLSSIAVLFVIAIERYRKICVPHGRQMSLFWAKCCICFGICFAIGTSWPSLILFGNATIETGVANVTASRCDIVDKYADTNYPAYYNMGLISVVIIVSVVLAVLYSRIGQVILTRSTFKPSDKVGPVHRTSVAHANNKPNQSEPQIASLPVRETIPSNCEVSAVSVIGNCNDVGDTNGSSIHKDSSKMGIVRQLSRQENTKQQPRHGSSTRLTVLSLFMITVVFAISYTPVLVLMTVTSFNKTFEAELSFPELVMYNIGLWCFFTNNVANPIIYGFCDVRFRKHLRDMYGKFMCKRGKYVA